MNPKKLNSNPTPNTNTNPNPKPNLNPKYMTTQKSLGPDYPTWSPNIQQCMLVLSVLSNLPKGQVGLDKENRRLT